MISQESSEQPLAAKQVLFDRRTRPAASRALIAEMAYRESDSLIRIRESLDKEDEMSALCEATRLE